MPNEFRLRANIEQRLAFWPIETQQRLSVCFPELNPEVSIDEKFLVALADEGRTPLQRVTLAYIALHGRYPLPDSAQRIQAVLKVHGAVHALALLLEIERRSSGRKRKALRLDGVVVDVTKQVEEFVNSGIPRVVASVIESESFRDAELIVWDDGAPCLVARSLAPNGKISLRFTKDFWAKPHQRSRIVGRIHNRLAEYRWLLLLVSTGTSLLRGPILSRVFASRKPRYVCVLDDANILLPEVPSIGVAQATLNAIRSFPRLRSSLILHDMLPLTNPQFFADASVVNHAYLTQLATECSRVIVATPMIRDELVFATQLLGATPPRIVELMLPVPALKSEGGMAAGANPPYFVFMGGFDSRKGLAGLVDHLGAYEISELGFRVLVIGAPGAVPQQLALAHKIRRDSSVFEIQRQVDDSSLADLISNSCGVLYPSFAEGFGLPILEAVSLGVPAIVRSTPTNLWLAEQFDGILASYDEGDPELLSLLRGLAGSPIHHERGITNKPPISAEEWSRTLSKLVKTTFGEREGHHA